MLYELRIYTCKPGTMEIVLDLWQRQGQAMIDPHMKMVAQWTALSGTMHRIFTVWEFQSLEHRNRARAALIASPGFAEYLAKCRDHYVEQEVTFLSATPLSPIQ